MKRDFTHREFEDYLKQSADDLRMRPPDRVWQNLSGELNKRRRRFFFGLSSFLLVATTAGYFIITNVPANQKTSTPTANTPASEKEQTQGARINQTTNSEPAAIVVENTSSSVVENTGSSITASRQSETTKPTQGNPLRVAFRAAGAITAERNATGESELTATARPSTENTFTPTVVDSYTEFDKTEAAPLQGKQQTALPSQLPYTVESVLNSFRQKKAKPFETQLYFAPTVSYRKLTENKSYLRSLPQTAANYPAFSSSVNNNVTHKPDVGFELGFAAKYRVSNHLKVRSGVQFNVNRYDVKAFLSQPTNATIALNNGLRIDSLNTYSRYSNVNGYRSDWLQNLSFQVSAPVGAEYLFGSGAGKVQFGVAGTVQPTYVLGDRAYLITTDYKSYTQVPWLVRRWNVNTSFETFVNIDGPKTRWQIAPQVRYQLLSSFISEYPVKENLFDFGLKVGISLNK